MEEAIRKAKKLNVGPSQIHHYGQGSVTLLSERLWEIAEKLSVNPEDLMKKIIAKQKTSY